MAGWVSYLIFIDWSRELSFAHPSLPSYIYIYFFFFLVLFLFVSAKTLDLAWLAWMGVVLDGRGSGGTSPLGYMAPKPSAKEAAPQLLIQEWLSQSCQRPAECGGPRPASTACSWASCKHLLWLLSQRTRGIDEKLNSIKIWTSYSMTTYLDKSSNGIMFILSVV